MKFKGRKSSSTPSSRRKLYIFTGLLSALVGTSAFLLAMAPAPLKPDGAAPALASYSESPSTENDTASLPDLQGVLDTRVPVQPNAWRYLYIHHSRTAPGPISRLGDNPGDHFVITSPPFSNTTTLSTDDGRVEMTLRWSHQVPALPPPGVKSINPQCISICLVGDLDRNVPTPAQFQRTLQLVRTLQKQLRIPAGNVLVRDDRGSAAGVGRMFPVDAFRERLAQ